MLEHLRKPTTTRPSTEKKLISYLVAYLGHKITDVQAAGLIKNLSQAGHLAIDAKSKVIYHIERI